MELIDRYLQAVQFWLPKQQKHDIIAELSEDIHAQIEEQETGLGRKLTEAEIEGILRQRGRPVLVANRFLPQEHLIGPVLFPIYRFVLKIVMLGYMVPWTAVWIGTMIYSPAYRAEHLSDSWFEAIGSAWSSWWGAAVLAVGTVTIVFAILERLQAKKHFLEEWSPRKLPTVRNPSLIARTSSSFELAFNLIFLVWWAVNMYSPIAMLSPDVRISVSPLWPYFFWSFLLLGLVNTAVSSINLMRPYWTGSRAALRLFTDCAGSALFCWFLKANILVGIAIAHVSPDRTLEMTNALNMWMGKAFQVAIAVGVVIACGDVYRIVRLKTAIARTTFQALAH